MLDQIAAIAQREPATVSVRHKANDPKSILALNGQGALNYKHPRAGK